MPLSTVLFELGEVIATPLALQTLQRAKECALPFLARHQQGDWGEVTPAHGAANLLAFITDGPILSVYATALGERFWVVTEPDRSATYLLVPGEYSAHSMNESQ